MIFGINWLLALNCSLAVVGVLIFIYGLIIGDDDWWGGALIGLILLFNLGFGMVGGLVNLEYKTTELDVEMTRTHKSIILEDYGNSGKIYIFDKKVDFNYITDTTTFYFEQGYNMYNLESDGKSVFYLDEKNIICKGTIR